MRDDIQRAHTGTRTRGLSAAGVLLGLGLGAMVEGILLRAVLGWHHMVSARVPATGEAGLADNLYWDGVFLAAAWVVVLVGVLALFAAGRRADVRWASPVLVGGMLIGAGLFAVVDGVVSHLVLGWHHVREGIDWFMWDLVALAIGAVTIMIGAGLARTPRPLTPAAPAEPADDDYHDGPVLHGAPPAGAGPRLIRG